MTRLTAALLIIGATLTGCGTLGTAAPTATHSPTPPASVLASDAADAFGTVHAEIDSGPLVGEYTAVAESPLCTSGLSGEGSFGVQYTVDEPQGLSRVEILIPVASMASTGTDQFTASIGFGPLVGGTTFEFDPVANGGTGTALLDYDGGNTASLLLEAETAEGIGMTVEVECSHVVQL